MRKDKNWLPLLAQNRQSAKRIYKKVHEAYKTHMLSMTNDESMTNAENGLENVDKGISDNLTGRKVKWGASLS